MEPEGSLPYSQQPIIGPFLKLDEFNTHPAILFLLDPF
jgi:hypothetical protein